MNIDPRIAALKAEATSWRRDFHANPEIQYEVTRTAGIVAAKLREFGCDEVVEGIGRTGVVGVIHGRNGPGGRAIGLRADMDALPIEEESNLPHRSQVAGKMHACGHDGHTAMLLGAAKHLAATREFDGTAIMIFQPAEEGGRGAKAMVDDGLMERWNIAEVYGMHNIPGMKPGHFAMRPGPMMAAADRFSAVIEGRGAHAAMPHLSIDPVLTAAHVITALQTIAARNVDPLKSVVVTTTIFNAGKAFNVIPPRVEIGGTVRTLEPEVHRHVEARLRTIITETARMFGCEARVEYEYGCPATINHAAQTKHAAITARKVAGEVGTDIAPDPTMGGEDFAFMLNARPGAYIFIGNGQSASLHHPAYDFNDDILPAGIQFWTELAAERTRG